MIKKLFKFIGFVILLFLGIYLLTGKDLSHNNFKVHYIEVWHGDSILIQVNNKNILIDSGPSSNQKKLFDYLNELNIKTFDYVIATHPHNDHIGNFSSLINNYEIKEFYMPDIVHTTPTYTKLINTLSEKKITVNKITNLTPPLTLSKNCILEFIVPNAEKVDKQNSLINNQSIVTKLSYINSSFLFCADIEKEAEKSLLNMNINLKADVLKIAHHGSNTSSTNTFLNAVNPQLAIISVGKDNNFNLPNSKVTNRLKEKFIQIYRTDIDGTIVISSDGTNIYLK